MATPTVMPEPTNALGIALALGRLGFVTILSGMREVGGDGLRFMLQPLHYIKKK